MMRALRRFLNTGLRGLLRMWRIQVRRAQEPEVASDIATSPSYNYKNYSNVGIQCDLISHNRSRSITDILSQSLTQAKAALSS